MRQLFFFVLFIASPILSAQKSATLDDLLLKALDSQDSSAHYFTQAKELVKTKADTANYLYFKFYHLDKKKEDDSANYYAKAVIPMFKKLDTLERLRKIYTRLHYQKLRQGNYEEALNYTNMALAIAEKLKDTALVSLHNSDKSIVYHDFEDYEKGVEYGKKAFKIMNDAQIIKYKYLIFANNATAINFDDWGKADSALFYHYKNLTYLDKVEDSTEFTFIFNNIGNTYLKQKKYKIARQFVSRALAMNKVRDDHYRLATNYTNLATISYEEGENEAAKKYFIEAYYYAEKSESIEKIRDVVQQEAWFYKKIGDFEKALERQEAFYVLRDSVFNVERAEKVAEMEVRYETEKTGKQLAETRANLAESELRVKRRNTLLFGSFGLALVLGLLGYLVYKQQKMKQRQLEKESELKAALARVEIQNSLQEQRLRISRDLHDNIGSQLTFIISSIDSLKFGLKNKSSATAEKLTKISGFASQTIYELRDTIWAMNKNNISWEDLQARISNFIEKAGSTKNKVAFSYIVPDYLAAETVFSSIQGMNIYRIIQEAVNNAIKYSEATKISVSINEVGSNFEIKITDDGIGFDNEKVEMGNGLLNIKKRAKDLLGNAEIISEPGAGTMVLVTFKR